MRRVAWRFYALRATDEGIPYFPVYALRFADARLSAGQISSLFAIWSVTTFALEIPSGAWADAFSRRWLLAGGAVLRAAGFAVWTVWPTYTGFALGFVLWGIRSATSSGTREALVYDELAALDAKDSYVRVMGRAGTVALTSMAAVMALAAPAYAYGGYELVGWASVAVGLAGAGVALSFPSTPRVGRVDGESGLARYAAHLRAGLAEARRSRRLRHALVLAAAVSGLAAIDEYLPLLARDLGASTASVPLLLLLPVVAMAVASWWAHRWSAASPTAVGGAIAAAGVLLAIGALSGHPVGMLAVAGCFGLLELGRVLTQARLQDTIRGSSRATVLSVSGFGAELVALSLFGGVALSTRWWGVPAAVAGYSLPVLLMGLLTRRWLLPDQHSPLESANTIG